MPASGKENCSDRESKSHWGGSTAVQSPRKDATFVSLPSKENSTETLASPSGSEAGRMPWQGQPWPLLASPKSPPGQPSENCHLKRDGGPLLNPSPAVGGWPNRSPIKPEHDQDVASFTLFTQSFDTLSESGNYFRHENPDRQVLTSPASQHPPRRIRVGNPPESDVGDISPIQLDDHRPRLSGFQPNASHQHGGRPPLSTQQPVEFAPERHFGYSGWTPQHGASANPSSDMSNPFYVLRSVRKAFDRCTYKLPCLFDREVCPVHLSHMGSIRRYQDPKDSPDLVEVELASRRVEAAVCAFGGHLPNTHPVMNSSTIFRHRKTPSKDNYDNYFRKRYYVAGNHISWELEENPPVELSKEGDDCGSERGNENDPEDPSSSDKRNEGPGSEDEGLLAENQQKMKYRCKLCGKWKQNHNCPYQHSLQRSIAVMVHPVVNAYTASEPGILTKPLSEMNNFVSYDLERNDGSPDHPPGGERITHVTPETKTRLLHSPESSLSTHSADLSPAPQQRDQQRVQDMSKNTARSRGFADTLTLRPEHYRAVSPRHTENSQGYQYPPVPLTFQERKRLSDTLFFLSKEIPSVTANVADLLRRAREKEEWDMAVSHVLTQVIVALYCAEGDHRLDGLQQYLLGVGICC